MRSAYLLQLIALIAFSLVLAPKSHAEKGNWAYVGGSYSTLYGTTGHVEVRLSEIQGSETSAKLKIRGGSNGE